MSVRVLRFVACLLAAFIFASNASAQTTQAAEPTPSELPPVVVETAKPKAKKQAAKKAPAATAATQPTAPAPQPTEETGQGESALGPVNGLVATRSATATKTDTPLLETPQMVNVVPADQIQAQGAQSINESLRYTPGVFAEPLGAAAYTSTFIRSRGFYADLYLDGLRLPTNAAGAAFPEVEPFNLERVEVLKGPSSSLYGSSGPGGLINMVSKRPSDVPIREIAVQTGSFDRKQAQFDIGDKVVGTEDVAFRVVGLIRESDTQFDYLDDNREFIAPSLTWKLSSDTKLTLLSSYFHQDLTMPLNNFLPASGTVLANPNGKIKQSFYNGDPSYDDLEREQYMLGYAFEHRFSDALTFRQNLRYSDVSFEQFAVSPAQAGRGNDPQTGLQSVGNPGQNLHLRGNLHQQSDTQDFTVDSHLEGRFATGALQHSAVVGLDYRKTESSYAFELGATTTSIDLFDPTYGNVIGPAIIPFQDDLYDNEQIGVYAQDQIKFSNFILTLGGRYDWASTLTDNRFDAQGYIGAKDEAFTGRVALGYVFDNGVAPYVSYATSFDPVAGTDIAGTPLEPTTGEQYEAGIKYQPPGTKTLLSAAIFDLTQQNVVRLDPFNFGQTQTGEIQVKGFEFEARSELTRNLSVVASYAYLDAEITKSIIPGEEGHRPSYTPEHQASAWLQYAFHQPALDGITVGGGVRYVGDVQSFQAVATPFVLEAPSYTLFDAMIAFELGKYADSLDGAILQINANNIADEYYITGCDNVIRCSMGQGRTVLGTLSYKW